MSNAITRAARERMARTGEPYTLARRKVIEERERQSQAPAPEADCAPAEAAPEGEFARSLLAPLAAGPGTAGTG